MSLTGTGKTKVTPDGEKTEVRCMNSRQGWTRCAETKTSSITHGLSEHGAVGAVPHGPRREGAPMGPLLVDHFPYGGPKNYLF